MAALAGLMGCCVFLPDQERHRYRFFAEHNIPPRYVWFSRHFVWIPTLFASTLMICLFWVPSASLQTLWQLMRSATSWPTYYWQWQLQRYGQISDFVPFVELPPKAIGLVCVALSYSAGQWTSMFVRSGIMAGFFGLVLSGVLCGWAALMYAMQVSFLWSVAPIPLVLLWATWLRAPDWVSENTRWRCAIPSGGGESGAGDGATHRGSHLPRPAGSTRGSGIRPRPVSDRNHAGGKRNGGDLHPSERTVR